MREASSESRFARRAPIATAAPASAKANAVASPIPDEAPVIAAVFPSSAPIRLAPATSPLRQLHQHPHAEARRAASVVGAPLVPRRASDVHVHPWPLVHELAQELGR